MDHYHYKLEPSWKNLLKVFLIAANYRLCLRVKTNYLALFVLKITFQKKLTSGVVYKFQCGLCNKSYYGECVRHLNLRTGDHIGISPLTKKKVKPKGSAVSDQLSLCNHSSSFKNFSVPTKENRKFALELKESLLILRDKPLTL